MNVETTIRTISLVLAPVVMISSCTLFLNGLLQRYDSISDRMRKMHLERIELLRAAGESITSALKTIGDITELRIRELEFQLPNLLRRHTIIRNAILVMNLAILIFVVSMFVIAIAAVTNSSLVATLALCFFLAGTASLLVGVIISAFELYDSHRAVKYEVVHGLSLGESALSKKQGAGRG